jgi:hypothetical protein
MFVVYGDVNGAKPLGDLQAFAEAVIDLVILDGGVEDDYNTVDTMKSAFSTNYAALAAAANGLYTDFKFFNNVTAINGGVTTVREGSGATFDITADGSGSYTVDVSSGGTNYLPGHKIKILGSALGGEDVTNDLIIEVNSTSEGSILTVTPTGASIGLAVYPLVSGTNYEVGNGFTVNVIYADTSDVEYLTYGTNYVVGDVITLLGANLTNGTTPENNITLIVTAVDGIGQAYQYTSSGTIPEVWPTNSIDDGGADQYDTANYISTNLAQEINYNGGETVVDGVAAFGTGSTYSFVYDTAIFGVFATGSSATLIRTSGNSGADGSSVTVAGNIYGPDTAEQVFNNAVTHINITGGDGVDGIRFSDGTTLESAEGVGRVKLESTGNRRIEEVYGYKSVSVTEKATVNLTATASRNSDGIARIWVDSTTTTIDEILNDTTAAGITDNTTIEFSVDNINWYGWGGTSFDGDERGFVVNLNGDTLTYSQGDTVYFRYEGGGAPVTWWDKSELPGGDSNFRGAVIDYHAYTGESTIIGTIHIVDDDGEDHITHTEVQSGSADGENDDLWLVTTEGRIRYRRIDGESKTLKIQWSAKVFYGSELYD